ncbi:expressed unknown protein [Seminavis robusta]|uniref:Uncharacterized protein n=1 Tax=Seminavis robusta TaxID=568900 RepID=A0A9N8EP30_9STRA|nr:expressed unknown protein [Seminavis robusta]|eukprot:Sro1351_g265260.1 n/a (135) ;mRNA; f:19373-19777
MMKVILVSLLAATAAAFSVVPAVNSKTSKTALFYYNYQDHSHFDVTGKQGIEMTETSGVALVQGGSDIGYAMGAEWPECDVDDLNCMAIEPECDVIGEQGCLVNMEQIGTYRVQGGTHNEWTTGKWSLPHYNQF